MTTTLYVSSEAELNADIVEANSAGGSFIIVLQNDITLTSSITGFYAAGGTLTIEGNGFALDDAGGYTGFGVFGGNLSSLTIENLSTVNTRATPPALSSGMSGIETIASNQTVTQTSDILLGSANGAGSIVNQGTYDIDQTTAGLTGGPLGEAYGPAIYDAGIAGDQFSNEGTLEKSGDSGVEEIYVNVTDTGTISDPDIASNIRFDGANNSFSGTYIGGGMIDYGDPLTPGYGTDDLGTINMVDGACTTNFATVDQSGVVTASTSSTITNEAIWNFTSNNGIVAVDPTQSTADFSNVGIMAKTGGTGTTALDVDFNLDVQYYGDVIVNTGTLAFDGLTNFFDFQAISGSGTLSMGGGGTDSIGNDTTIASGGWTITDAGTDVTLNEALSYSGNFTEQASATLTLDANLTLTGTADFANATVNGSDTLTTNGPTSVTGAVTFASDVTLTGTGLVSIGSSSTLNVLGSVDSGTTIKFAGTDGLLDIGRASGFSGTIKDFASGDTLAVSTTIMTATPGTFSSGITPLVLKDGSTTVATLSLEGNYQGDTFTVTNPSVGTYDINTPCYCRGTLIRSECGEVPVEALTIGHKVLTKSGEQRPIKWIGRRTYGGRFLMGRKDALPICINAGALDDRVPQRDLWLSPHHALYLDGMLIEAKDLVNGVSIVQADRVEKVEYFHIELETHDVIVAEGALAESFIDDDSRGMFSNVHEYRQLYGDRATGLAQFCAPRREDGYPLEVVRQRIALRAGVSAEDDLRMGGLRGSVDRVSADCVEGWAQNMEHPEAPVCLDIYTSGRLIGQVLANHYRDDLAKARLGTGRHGFVFMPQRGLIIDSDKVEVRRSLDAVALAGTRFPRTAAA